VFIAEYIGQAMNKIFNSRLRLYLRIACCVFFFLPAWAASAALAEPSVEEMVNALAAKKPAETGGVRMRSLGAKQTAPAAARLALSVQFEFASAKVSAESRELLSKLGAAMNSPKLVDLQFRIEGHTDAVGDAKANQRLSEQRAGNVKQFLVSAGIQESRLSAVGKGSSEPIDKANPKSDVNRRVVVVALEAAKSAPVAAATSSAPIPPVAAKNDAPSAGTVQKIQGEVTAMRANASVALVAGEKVWERDTISTAANSSVLVQLDDGAKLLVRPNTKVELSRIVNAGALEKLGHSLQLVLGGIRYVTGSVGASRPQNVRFKTPTATIGIRGTDLEIVYAPKMRSLGQSGTYVRVNTGGVELAGSDGSTVSLNKDEQAFAAPQGPKMRSGARSPAARKLDMPAVVFASGELDSLLETR
jgi:OmpA-OmpF porin, OOP family